MQLRNRLVKADFWTDTELAQKLPTTGRMLYQGLWQLAEDSGVIEADPVAYKMILFPLDNIQIEQIKEWTDTLVELGKLIPFSKGKNKYYYIKNFHKHQSLRSPGKPELPLPEWIEYVPNNKKRQSGGYIINYDLMPGNEEQDGIMTVGNVSQTVLSEYEDRKETKEKARGDGKDSEEKPKGNRTDSVRKPYGQVTVTNKKENKNKNIELEREEEHQQDTIAITYEKVFSRMLSPYQHELLQAYVDDDEMDPDVVVRAIQIAGENNARSLKYVTSVLDNWREKKVKTVADAEKAIREFENQAKDKDPPRRTKKLERSKAELVRDGYT